MPTENLLIALHKKSLRNRAWLANAKICGCFYCLSEFGYEKISKWVGEGSKTALCPFCGIDSVLGFEGEVADAALLRQMHDHWFESTIRLTAGEWKDAIRNNAWPASLTRCSTGEQK